MDQIERAAIAMAGEDLWTTMSPELRDQYRELARRAQPVFQGGKMVPWEEVQLTARVELAKHSGSLTIRRADSTTLDRIARSIVAALKLSRYTVVYGPPDDRGRGITWDRASENDVREDS